jgi:hypothetical protein
MLIKKMATPETEASRLLIFRIQSHYILTRGKKENMICKKYTNHCLPPCSEMFPCTQGLRAEAPTRAECKGRPHCRAPVI